MKGENPVKRVVGGLALLGLAMLCSLGAGGCATYPERYECAGLGSAYWKERCLRWPGSDEWDFSDPCCMYLAQFYRTKGL
jgi:hypothetical protein